MYEKTAIAATLALAIALGAGTAGAATTATNTERSAAFYESALRLFNNDDYRGAVIQLRNALQRDDNNLAARLLLGRAHLRLGDGEGAEKQLKAALNSGADRAVVAVPLGRAYMLQGKYKLLLDEIRAGTGQPDIEVEILFLRGQAHFERHDLTQAEIAFQQALKLDANHVETLLGLARLRLGDGRFAPAEELTDRALELAPKNADASYVKCEIKRQLYDFKAALGHCNRAITLTAGRHIPARISRAAMLIDLGRHQEAQADVLYVRKRLPDDPMTAFLHALILGRQGKQEEMSQALRDASRVMDAQTTEDIVNDPAIMLMRGVIYYARKQFDEAYPHLSRYIEVRPHHVGARKMVGAILLRRQENAAAVKVLEPALARSPDDIELLALLGDAYMRTRNFNGASDVYAHAAALTPDASSLRMRLAMSRLALGEDKKAKEELRSLVSTGRGGYAGVLLGMVQLRNGENAAALETAANLAKVDPGNPFSHNLAGIAYLREKQYDKARSNFRRALKIVPDYFPANFNLAALDVRERRLVSAKSRLEGILRKHPEETRALFELAKIAEQEGDARAAIRWLDQLRKVDNRQLAPLLRLIELKMRMGETADALSLADELESANPRNLAVIEMKARALIAAGERSKAINALRQVSFAQEFSAPALVRIATIQADLRDYEGAQTSFKTTITRYPDYLPAHSALVSLEAELGGVKSALEMATALRTAYPTSPIGDMLTGDMLMRSKRYAEAAAAYRVAIGKRDDAALQVRLYNAGRKAGRGGEALAALSAWNRAHPENRAVERVLAGAYMSSGDTERAIRAHESIAARNPDDAAVLNNLALLYLRKGDLRALAVAQQAYNLSPTRPVLLDTYGWVLVQQGEVVKGLRFLREAQARASASPSVGYHVAFALSKLGRMAEARRELTSVLASNKDFREASDARALLKTIGGK